MSKELEAFDNIKKYLVRLQFHFLEEDLNIIEKSLKALEIIKKKGVNVYYLLYYMLPENKEWGGYDNYKKDWFKKNEYCSPKNDLITTELLTQEEYDLLKKVLSRE